MPTIPILANFCAFAPNVILRAKAFILIEVVIRPISIALRLFKIIILVIALMDFYILQIIITQMQFVFQNALSPVDGGLSGDKIIGCGAFIILGWAQIRLSGLGGSG